jgi:hypothetical protein
MLRIGLAFGLWLCGILVSSVQADPYRWCAEGMGDSGASNCYFLTLEQCQAAVSGAGAFCRPNNFYTSPTGSSRRSKPRH